MRWGALRCFKSLQVIDILSARRSRRGRLSGAYRHALFAAFVLAGLASPARADNASPAVAQWALHKEPLFLFVAEGPPNSCGLGCNRWIAAEGFFDKGAADRLIKFVDGRANLPIYFHTAGGFLFEAIKIGKHLRKLRTKAGVGRTAIQKCDGPATSIGCRQLVETTAAHPAAQLRFSEGLCLSACAYAFIGASTRTADSGARIGVHDMHVDRAKLAKFGVDPKAVTAETLKKADQIARGSLRTYLAEMGADPALVEFGAKISPTAIHMLSRPELERFGVVSKAHYETPWLMRDETMHTAYTVFKTVSRPSPLNGKENLTTTIGLTCYVHGMITFFVERELAAGENGHEPTIQILSDDAVVWTSNNENNTNPRIDYRGEALPLETVMNSVPKRSLEFKESYVSEKWSGKSFVTKVSIAGLDASLADLRRRCAGKS
jgi:hypothetical protein